MLSLLLESTFQFIKEGGGRLSDEVSIEATDCVLYRSHPSGNATMLLVWNKFIRFSDKNRK